MKIKRPITTRDRHKYNPSIENSHCNNDGIIEFTIDNCAQICISNTNKIYQIYILLNNEYEPLYLNNEPVTLGYLNNTCLTMDITGTFKIDWDNKKPNIEIFETCEFKDSDLVCIKPKGVDAPTEKAFLYVSIKNNTVTKQLYSIDGNDLNIDDYIISNCC